MKYGKYQILGNHYQGPLVDNCLPKTLLTEEFSEYHGTKDFQQIASMFKTKFFDPGKFLQHAKEADTKLKEPIT